MSCQHTPGCAERRSWESCQHLAQFRKQTHCLWPTFALRRCNAHLVSGDFEESHRVRHCDMQPCGICLDGWSVPHGRPQVRKPDKKKGTVDSETGNMESRFENHEKIKRCGFGKQENHRFGFRVRIFHLTPPAQSHQPAGGAGNTNVSIPPRTFRLGLCPSSRGKFPACARPSTAQILASGWFPPGFLRASL